MERPIFVVGTMRSGSTVFRLILDAHPRISISEETGFMGAVAATTQIPNWHHGQGWYERIGWTAEELDARMRTFWSGLFERHAQSQGKQRWGEKTPFHSRHMARMATVFPDAVFVAIVRHPGAVTHSLVRKFHYQQDDAAAYWVATNKEILRRGAELGADRFALLRYEDLVTEPEKTLRELMDWLGEPWSDDLLRHNAVQSAQGAPRISAGNTHTRQPLARSLPDRWLEAFTREEQQVLIARTGEFAALLGYDAARPGVAAELASGAEGGPRRLLTGGALAAKLREHETLSLDDADQPVILPEMDVAELAKRLQQVEAALSRIRSRRAIRWSNALRRAQKRLSTMPAELWSSAGRVLRRD